jgi:nitrogen-specific signal transduction histidine kinase
MNQADLMAAILDSMKNPVLFADTGHVTRYMNKAAERHYEQGRALVGRSLLECHNAESQRMMKEILAEMEGGLEERLITDNEKSRIYMRAVRDAGGKLLGYYERYEPPIVPPPVS